MKASQSTEARQARRKKRLQSRGDRQFFAAQRKIRRDKIDKWMLKHKPEKFKARLAQLTYQAIVRQKKQEARDVARAGQVGEES